MDWLFVKRLRPFVLLAALASLVFNVTLLMPAIYMMQVFDRVFASRSVETLVMLGLITLVFLALGFFVDAARARALAWCGRSLDRKLAPAAIRSSLQQSAAGPGRVDTDALRDIAQLRTFLGGPGILALFDAPWLAIYLLIIALMHPALGLAAIVGALVLVALGVLTDRLTREHTEQTLTRSRASTRLAERFARNAEAVIGMGMTRTVVTRWSAQHDQLLGAQERQAQTSSVLSALARTIRQVLQVAVLALGAWLVIDLKASAGVMVAATILLSRALQPVEYLISGWRAMIEARGAWRRLSERIASPVSPTVALPAPAGRLDVERLAYSFAGTRAPLIRNIAFSLQPATAWGSSDRVRPARPRCCACCSDCGVRKPAPCASTAPTSPAGTATSSAHTWATCRRTWSCSPAPWARTLPASAKRSARRPRSASSRPRGSHTRTR